MRFVLLLHAALCAAQSIPPLPPPVPPGVYAPAVYYQCGNPSVATWGACVTRWPASSEDCSLRRSFESPLPALSCLWTPLTRHPLRRR